MKKQKTKKQTAKATRKPEEKKVAGATTTKTCSGRDCPTHGNLKARGKTFEGIVVSKFDKRLAIEFERMIYIKKYERYAKSKTKVHARLPECMEDKINLGDTVRVQECRPLSKIIHFVVIKKIKDKEEK